MDCPQQAFAVDPTTNQRRTMYDATPVKMRGRKEPALAVLGEQVQGSEIGRGKESETLLINSVEIRGHLTMITAMRTTFRTCSGLTRRAYLTRAARRSRS